MVIGDVVVRKSYDKDITFKIIDIKEVDGKTIYILKGISIRIIADSPETDLEPVDVDFIGEKEKILNSRVNEAIKKAVKVISKDANAQDYEFYVLNGENQEGTQIAIDELHDVFGEDIQIHTDPMYAVIAVHTGLGAVGVQFVKKVKGA